MIKLSLKIGQQTIQSIEPLDPWTDIWREDYMAGIFLPPSKLSPSSICTFFLCNFRVPFPQLGKRMLLDILHPCLVVLLVSILICINSHSTLTLEGINTLTQIINKVKKKKQQISHASHAGRPSPRPRPTVSSGSICMLGPGIWLCLLIRCAC